MRRLFRHKSTWVFAAAVLASLAVHLPAYEVLGVLRDVFARQRLAQAPGPMEVEFEVADDTPDEPIAEDETEPPQPAPAAPRPPPERSAPAHRPTPVTPPAPVTPPEPEVVPPQAPPAVEPPPQAQRTNPQAIQQRSADPSVEPPPDARFIARENSRVEEETQARLRSLTQDAPEPSAGAAHRSEEPEEGNDQEQESAETQDREGSDARRPTPEELDEPQPAQPSVDPPPDVVATGDGRPDQRARAAQEQARQAASEVREERSVRVTDGDGSFVVRLPRVARQAMAGHEGGERARSARRAGEGRGRGQEGPDLTVAWSQFEEVAGRENLERDRQAYLAQRRSRQRGSSHQRRWREFRAAIENYVPGVRPGNQTALNAAASPFAEYIAAVHRRIHPQYAGRFLAGLPTFTDNPFSDRTLMTKLEIVLERDGRVHRVGVVRTSGFLPFDYGAFAAVMRAQPFPEAPTSILSGDGRVYLRWGFYRNERQCGTFNAEPYILPNPPGTPRDHGGGLRDAPSEGGVIPSNASPTWGTRGESRGPDGAATEGRDPGGTDEGAPARAPGDDPDGETPRAPPAGAPPPERPSPVAVPAGAALG